MLFISIQYKRNKINDALQVREYLQENSVHAVLNDLFFLALDIFNR